jgi:hypothetical protein
MTVTAADPVFPSTVATIVADPAASAATPPEAETVATAGLVLVQTTDRPPS